MALDERSGFACGVCFNGVFWDFAVRGESPGGEEVFRTKLISPALADVAVVRVGDSSSTAEEDGPSFSVVPFIRAALSAMLFAFAFLLATPPRAFFTVLSPVGFSLAVCSFSKYPAN